MNDILLAIEAALSDAWGGPVRVTFREYLESRRHIARLDVVMSPPELPKSVIVKRWRSEGDAGFDQNSFDYDLLNEWASLEFVAHRLSSLLCTMATQFQATRGLVITANALSLILKVPTSLTQFWRRSAHA